MSNLMQLIVAFGAGTIILVVVLAITYFYMSSQAKENNTDY
jgi:hypothetical protein